MGTKKWDKAGFTLPSIISPKAYVSKHSKIGDGTVIMHHAIINGGVKIGLKCFIGSNVTTKNNIIIKENSFIKAGTLVK